MKELALNILDIVQNSIRAEADLIKIEIRESQRHNLYRIIITDNGKGIPDGILEHVTDPFVTTRTKRKMGLGLPLLKYHAELTGGELKIESEADKGTVIKATFLNNHIDRQPLGDITGVLKILIASNPGINFIYRHSADNGEYTFSTDETKEFLMTENLNGMDLLQDIGLMIKENLMEINASGLKI
jgi:anti-sigma regulatory factor (Ser/Thr protein kinase)